MLGSLLQSVAIVEPCLLVVFDSCLYGHGKPSEGGIHIMIMMYDVVGRGGTARLARYLTWSLCKRWAVLGLGRTLISIFPHVV